MTYQVFFDRADDGTVWARLEEMSVFGCGATIEEAKASLIEGLRGYIEFEASEGRSIPPPSIIATDVITVNAA